MITVEIKPLSRRHIVHYAKMIERRPDIKGNFGDNALDIQWRQFSENVGGIENLKHPITDAPIKTAEELYDAPGMSDLVAEIIRAMEDISVLTPGLEKNFAPPSGGA